jgi:hypothetical protein
MINNYKAIKQYTHTITTAKLDQYAKNATFAPNLTLTLTKHGKRSVPAPRLLFDG